MLMLANTFDGSTVSRARGLVARGQALDLEIEPATAAATVRGRSSLERRVRIGVRRFTADQWEGVTATLAASSRMVAAVLDGDLPAELHQRLEECGCALLPNVRDVSIDCTCGNLAESCVHAAAACCLLADAIDSDPLILITLRGGDRAAVLAAVRPARAGGGSSVVSGPLTTPSCIPGRPDDPTMAAASAWKRKLAELPSTDQRRRHVGRPRIGAQPPPAELGFDQAGLDRLAGDAALRASRVLAGFETAAPATSTALLLDLVTDAVRRCAVGTLDPAAVAAIAATDVCGVEGLVDAWKLAGPAGVDVLLQPRRLDADELAAVESACGSTVRPRSTGALLPDGRQVRRSADATWILLTPGGASGWTILDSASCLAELAELESGGNET